MRREVGGVKGEWERRDEAGMYTAGVTRRVDGMEGGRACH